MVISVIIPVFNGESVLATLFDAIARLEFSPELETEIIFVNDGSEDGTQKLLEGFRGEWGGTCEILKTENRGPAAARNLGAREAKGEILLFTDADCAPDEKWLIRMTAPFAGDPELGGVKGVYRTAQTGLIPSFVQLEYEYKYRRMQRFQQIDFVDTYSAGYRRGVFLKHGGFSTEYPVACAEDIEFSFRLKKEGVRMLFLPDAVVLHRHPDSPAAYLKKKMKFAYWRLAALEQHPAFLISDSHTPQSMKYQVSILFFLCLAVPVSFVAPAAGYSALVLGLVYIILCIPFWLFLIRRQCRFLFFGFPLFLLRSSAQAAGICSRIFKKFLLRRG